MSVAPGIMATGAGERLRAAREARGLDIQQVANELKLPARHIEAIEAEDAVKLPAPSYTCAYLRKYAALVQLPSDEVVEAFPGMKEYLAGVRSTVMPTRLVAEPADAELRTGAREARVAAPVDRTNLIMIAVAALVAVLLFTQVIDDDDDVAVTPAPEERSVAGSGSAERAGPEAAVATPPATSPAAAAAEPAAKAEAAAENPVPTAAKPELPPLPPMSEITFTFRGDSWLEVNDATGVRLAFELGRAGQSRTLRGPAPFNVILGVAGNVDIKYNGADFDMSALRGRELAELNIGRVEDNRTGSN